MRIAHYVSIIYLRMDARKSTWVIIYYRNSIHFKKNVSFVSIKEKNDISEMMVRIVYS
jgi:hypothetical protein